MAIHERIQDKIEDPVIIDLGLQPISNRFLQKHERGLTPKYPMTLKLSLSSGLAYLEAPFPVDEIKPHVSWLTCYEPEEHLDSLVTTILSLKGISKDSLFGAYSFKDDTTLNRLFNLGYTQQWRLDPQADLGIFDPCAGVETYQSIFSEKVAQGIAEKKGKVDVMIVRHVVEHAYNLSDFIRAIQNLVKPNGYIVWELPDCKKALENGDCTTIWEEHTHYFTEFTFKVILNYFGFIIEYFESVNYPLENSIVAIVKNTNKPPDLSLISTSQVEKEVERCRSFSSLILQKRNIIREKLSTYKKNNGLITLFGAGHLSVAFLSILKLEDLIDFVIDDNPNKKGMLMPIGDIEIRGSDTLYKENVSLCLLGLNPNNQPGIIKRHKAFQENGGVFASIFPGTLFYLELVI